MHIESDNRVINQSSSIHMSIIFNCSLDVPRLLLNLFLLITAQHKVEWLRWLKSPACLVLGTNLSIKSHKFHIFHTKLPASSDIRHFHHLTQTVIYANCISLNRFMANSECFSAREGIKINKSV